MSTFELGRWELKGCVPFNSEKGCVPFYGVA
jgi:hypothetical protein